MPEFVPPPPELREQLEEQAPLSETLAERIGDRVFKWFEPGDENEPRGFFSGAVKEALETVLGRMLLTFSLPVVCGLFIYGYLKGSALFDIRDPWRYWDYLWAVNVLLIVTAVTSGAASFILPMVDAERKVVKLNWITFTFIASGALVMAHEKCAVLVLLTGHFGIHWMIYSAIRLRERQAEWEWRRCREEARLESPRNPRLLQRHAGVSDFDKSAGPSGAKNDSQES